MCSQNKLNNACSIIYDFFDKEGNWKTRQDITLYVYCDTKKRFPQHGIKK